jgi:hypothetical protein
MSVCLYNELGGSPEIGGSWDILAINYDAPPGSLNEEVTGDPSYPLTIFTDDTQGDTIISTLPTFPIPFVDGASNPVDYDVCVLTDTPQHPGYYSFEYNLTSGNCSSSANVEVVVLDTAVGQLDFRSGNAVLCDLCGSGTYTSTILAVDTLFSNYFGGPSAWVNYANSSILYELYVNTGSGDILVEGPTANDEFTINQPGDYTLKTITTYTDVFDNTYSCEHTSDVFNVPGVEFCPGNTVTLDECIGEFGVFDFANVPNFQLPTTNQSEFTVNITTSFPSGSTTWVSNGCGYANNQIIFSNTVNNIGPNDLQLGFSCITVPGSYYVNIEIVGPSCSANVSHIFNLDETPQVSIANQPTSLCYNDLGEYSPNPYEIEFNITGFTGSYGIILREGACPGGDVIFQANGQTSNPITIEIPENNLPTGGNTLSYCVEVFNSTQTCSSTLEFEITAGQGASGTGNFCNT